MKLLLCVFSALCGIAAGFASCPEIPPDLMASYRKYAYNHTIQTYRQAARCTGYHFVISSHQMWMSLAAMAEGADRPNQLKMFKVLSYPDNQTLREQFYEIATTRMSQSPYVKLPHKRALMLDEDVTPLPKWHNFVTEHSLLNVTYGPIKCDPKTAANKLRKMMSARLPNIKLQGNSVLFDAISFSGLWTEAFDDAIIKKSPFYNLQGERVGSVDLMTTRRRVRIGYLPSIQSKVIALQMGANKEYFIIFAVVVGDTDMATVIDNMQNSIVQESVDVLKDSVDPIYIGIPRITVTSELNGRTIMQNLGLKNLWTNPDASKFVSRPPALPGNYVQRTTISLNNKGVNPPPKYPPPCDADDYDYDDDDDDDDEDYGDSDDDDAKRPFLKKFIANRPFMWGLFDNQSKSVIIAAMYTRPTYPDPDC